MTLEEKLKEYESQGFNVEQIQQIHLELEEGHTGKDMKKTISEEVMYAAYVSALISDKDLSTVGDTTNSLVQSDEEKEPVNVVFEDEIPKEKKKRANKKKPKKKEVEQSKKLDLLPEWELGQIEKETEITVTFNEHDIPYKEQLWPIPKRTVVYVLSRVDLPQQAANIAERLHIKDPHIKDWMAKAKAGENRYLVLRTTTDSVKGEVRQIAYVEVTADKQVRFLVESVIGKRNHIDLDSLKDSMKRASRLAVKFNN